jgi:hypothetical protein
MISIITRIQIEGNDTVSFLNGTNYVQGMSQIMPQVPTYISYGYDSISITQDGSKTFQFSVYTVTDVGGNSFTALNFQDPSDVVQAKTIEIYRLLVTAIFKGCCECGNAEPECSIQYTAGTDPTVLGTLWDVGGVGMRINYFTANNQDFTGFWPIIQDGSWIFVFSKTDPTVYGVYQLSNYTDGGTFAQFDSTLLAGPGGFPDGTSLCVDVTSVGGSLVQGWQDTLIIDSVLTQDNTVDGGNFDFIFNNNNSFAINAGGGSVEVDAVGASLNGGTNQVLVTPSYIDIITPGIGGASTGWVLSLTAAGHVEYIEAGTGTISSIGLFMPPAFTVSTPNPLTSNGDFTVTGAGTDLQYINGLGELATFPVYTVENGLHAFGGVPGETPPDPFLFHLGGELVEDTVITTTNGTTEYVLGVAGTADQNTRRPLSVTNLGNGGAAVFSDFGAGVRPNPTVEMITDNDLSQPILNLHMQGDLPDANNTMLRLRYSGTPDLATTAIDYQFRNNNAVAANSDFIGSRLSTEVVNFVDNSEQTRFNLQLMQGGTLANRMQMEGFGQLILNNYATGSFANATANIDNTLEYVLAVKNDGTVWKKSATGGGTVQSISAAGLLTTSPNPITVTGTVTTSVNENRLVGRWDAAGTGIMQEITLGSNLDLTAAGVLNASGGGFDVQVNTTTIIPPGTILNLKSGTDINVVNEGGGNVRFDWAGSTPSQGLQDVIIVDNVLTQNNTVQGSVTSFVWKDNSFYEINPVLNYDPGTGSVPGYFKAWVGKYPPSYSELYVEAIYAQMKSIGATTQVVKVDTTGVYIRTPALGSASNGYVLTLVDQATGKADWQLGGSGGTYDGNEGIYKDTSLTNDTFMLGAPSGSQGTIPFAINRYIDVADKFLQMEGTSSILNLIENTAAPLTSSAALVVATDVLGFSASFTALQNSAVLANTQGADVYALEVSNQGTGSDSYAAYFECSHAHGIQVTQGTYSSFLLLGSVPSSSAIDPILSLNKNSSGTPGVGQGVSILFDPGKTSDGTTIISGTVLNSFVTDITPGAGAVDFRIDTYSAGASLNHSTFIADGQLKLHEYGQTPANFPDAAPVWALGVDSTGKVVEFEPAAGNTYTVDNGLSPQTLPTANPDNFQLGGPLVLDTNIDGASTHNLSFTNIKSLTGTAQDVYFAGSDGVNTGSLGLTSLISALEFVDGTTGTTSVLELNNTFSRFIHSDGTTASSIELTGAELRVKTPLHSAKTAGDVLTLLDPVTGEAEWSTPTGGGSGLEAILMLMGS